ncbi:MAG: TonB-dependent receptor [Bacteroidota bacterium]
MKTVLFTLLLTLGFIPVLLSQETAFKTTADEVVVTGAKYARPQAKSPHNITIIDSVQIAQAADLAQLLNEQPGIVINGAYSNPGKDRSIFLRNGGNQNTLILIDGQPLTDPSSLGGAVDLRLLSLDNIERIEILRGARSLLYGSDAIAGVINLITKTNQAADPFTLHLRAAAQTYNTLESSVAVSGSTRKLDYRLSYEFFDTDGISEAIAPADSVTTFQEDGSSRNTFNGSLTFRPNEYLTLRPTLRIANFDGDYDAGSFQDGDNNYTNDLLLPALSVLYSKGKSDVGGNYLFAKTDRVFTDAVFGVSEFSGRSHQAELFWNYQPTEKAIITAGSQLRQEQLVVMGDDPDLTATTISPYLQLNLTVTEALNVEAGYRFNQHSEFGGQSNFSLALGVQSTPTWSSRVAVASAFQSPTLDQLGGPFGANPELEPQVATSVEASTTLRHPEDYFAFTLTAFQRNIKDIITFASFELGYQNQNEALDNGVELSGRGRLGNSFTLDGNISYVNGTLTSPDGMGGELETTEFFRRPPITGSLGLSYAPKAPLSIRLSAHYTGERPDIWFDENFSSFLVDLDPYILVNAYAEYRLLKAKNLRLFLDVRNLTNSDFVEVTGFSTIGTTVRGGVSVRL